MTRLYQRTGHTNRAKKFLRTSPGETLLNVLLALLILGTALPPILASLTHGLSADLQILRMEDQLYGANWWFNRLETPAFLSSLPAMPGATPDGGLQFRWLASVGPHGELHISLDVESGVSHVPLTVSRTF